jgi:ribonuclease HII
MAILDKKITLEKDCFEKKAWSVGHLIVGVDEVGRGCLAGPVLAAAVALPINCARTDLKDSKIMTENQRNNAYEWIVNNCFVGVGMADQSVIDDINIYQATIVSMKKAIHNLYSLHHNLAIGAITIDAVPLVLTHPGLHSVPVHSFFKGESYSSSIAAASIVAKVTRDRIMHHLDSLFSVYNLKSHKGYGTAVHQDMIQDCCSSRYDSISRSKHYSSYNISY